MDPYINLPISEEKLKFLVNNATEYALSNGIVMGSAELPKNTVSFSPFCLLPSSFSQLWFNYAKEIQTTVNLLIHKVSNDREFMQNSLKRTIESDDFTAKLYKIYEQVNEEGLCQDISLGILRSDYMQNVDKDGKITGLKQVEINTVASSFGGLITKLYGLHSYILNQIEVDPSNFPVTLAVQKTAEGLVAARKAYGGSKTVILFMIEDHVLNFCDQRAIEYALLNIDPTAVVVRATFRDISEHGAFKNKKMLISGQEVAVVYYRTGYAPEQYESEHDWETRLKIEQSLAIKCPSVAYQLAGTKKIQQELALPGVLERFLSNPEDIRRLREVFANQYSLDLTEEGDRAVELALDTPERFVIKPQREGGGNNIYGEDVITTLEELGKSKEREGFILMELINPPPVLNYIIRPKKSAGLQQVYGELGIYGIILGNSKDVLRNYEAGHMMRSKVQGTSEGGVVAGYGVLDLPYLQ